MGVMCVFGVYVYVLCVCKKDMKYTYETLLG